MPEVTVRKGEPIDRALKRLKNKMETEGIIEEVRRLRAFETPLQRQRRKARSNAKKGRIKTRFQFKAPSSEDSATGAPSTGSPSGAPSSGAPSAGAHTRASAGPAGVAE